MSEPILEVRDLAAEFTLPEGVLRAVDGVSFEVYAGETLGLVGESGSGKSVTALTVMGLLPEPGRVVGGQVRFDGRDLADLDADQRRRLRGRHIGMVFQDPLSSLNPVFTVGNQLSEAMLVHDGGLDRERARRRGVELLQRVGVPDPAGRYQQYPNQWSGGMRQRAMIAMAMANDPKLLIADEPTTALDVTIQAQVLEVLRRARRETGAALLLITHDLGVIAETADRVAVMYAGRIVEQADVLSLFRAPAHPYTAGLLASRPSMDAVVERLVSIPGSPPNLLDRPSGCAFRERCALSRGRERCRDEVPLLRQVAPDRWSACHFAEEALGGLGGQVAGVTAPRVADGAAAAADGAAAARPAATEAPAHEPLLRVEDLVKHFPLRRGLLRRAGAAVHAVDGVSFDLTAGETLGLVGESGCGKSTVGRSVMRFLEPTDGRISYRGTDISHWSKRRLRELRGEVQIVFQDPHSSLNPRMSIADVVAEPLRIHGRREPAVGQRVGELLERVGLDPRLQDRFPHEFSGGQRQRIAIARALALEPRVVVLDEPVSSLDVSVQAQVTGLLQELQDELGLAYLFISHDLSVVHHLSERVAVMYLGKVVEIGTREQVFTEPRHPYTKALLEAVPVADPTAARERTRTLLHGDVPDPVRPPSGCRFRTRCWKAQERCAVETPELVDRPGAGHPVACHFPEVREPAAS